MKNIKGELEEFAGVSVGKREGGRQNEMLIPEHYTGSWNPVRI